MSEYYWYPFQPLLFANETRGLTPIARGMYRDLIDHYMVTGKPILDSDDEIMSICRIPYSTDPMLMQCYRDACSMLRAYFTHEKEGYLTHKKCEKVLKEQDAKKRERKNRAKKAAQKRWEKQEDNATSIPQAMHKAMLGDATNTYTDTVCVGVDTPTHNARARTKPEKFEDDFNVFWRSAYPRNGSSRAKAFESWCKAVQEAPPDEIIAAAKSYSDYLQRSDVSTAHATTWLNQKRWTVDYLNLNDRPKKGAARHDLRDTIDAIKSAKI